MESFYPPPRPKVAVATLLAKKKTKEILVGERLRNDNLYSLAGGSLEFFEEPEDCAIRELKEELGVTITKCQRFTTLNIIDKKMNFHFVVFIVLAFMPESQEITNLEPEKHANWIWVNEEELNKLKKMNKLFHGIKELTLKGTSKLFKKIF